MDFFDRAEIRQGGFDTPALGHDAAAFITNYRNCPEKHRAIIRDLASQMRSPPPNDEGGAS
jgi:hypothetical protein